MPEKRGKAVQFVMSEYTRQRLELSRALAAICRPDLGYLSWGDLIAFIVDAAPLENMLADALTKTGAFLPLTEEQRERPKPKAITHQPADSIEDATAVRRANGTRRK